MALQRFPGFIDIHVHLREPGATQKEDFVTGSSAAVAGGFTFIIDMPNNSIPTVTPEALQEKISLVQQKSLCDIGFHYGTDGKNLDSFPMVWNNPHVFGLKIYCNHTTGTLLVEDKNVLDHIFAAWKSEKPILVHAEGDELAMALELAEKHKRRLHVCHISQASEVALVRTAKKHGISVTVGVTPHHLFLADNDVAKLGSYAIMKPPLGTQKDQDALWEGIADGAIDVVESDHAPHTKEEKASEKPPFGVPGLETTVGLLFRAVHEKRLTTERVVTLLYDHPRAIFQIPDQPNTSIELDPQKPYIVGIGGYQTKCGWSPFDGWEVYGKVEMVMYKGNFMKEKK